MLDTKLLLEQDFWNKTFGRALALVIPSYLLSHCAFSGVNQSSFARLRIMIFVGAFFFVIFVLIASSTSLGPVSEFFYGDSLEAERLAVLLGGLVVLAVGFRPRTSVYRVWSVCLDGGLVSMFPQAVRQSQMGIHGEDHSSGDHHSSGADHSSGKVHSSGEHSEEHSSEEGNGEHDSQDKLGVLLFNLFFCSQSFPFF